MRDGLSLSFRSQLCFRDGQRTADPDDPGLGKDIGMTGLSQEMKRQVRRHA
jgi:hypothetical protein